MFKVSRIVDKIEILKINCTVSVYKYILFKLLKSSLELMRRTILKNI